VRTHAFLEISRRSGRRRPGRNGRARRLRIDLPAERVRAAIDGEPVVLEPPLELESAPRALRLLVPTTGGAMHDNPYDPDEQPDRAHGDSGE
jgi:hypothetical protein